MKPLYNILKLQRLVTSRRYIQEVDELFYHHWLRYLSKCASVVLVSAHFIWYFNMQNPRILNLIMYISCFFFIASYLNSRVVLRKIGYQQQGCDAPWLVKVCQVLLWWTKMFHFINISGIIPKIVPLCSEIKTLLSYLSVCLLVSFTEEVTLDSATIITNCKSGI